MACDNVGGEAAPVVDGAVEVFAMVFGQGEVACTGYVTDVTEAESRFKIIKRALPLAVGNLALPGEKPPFVEHKVAGAADVGV